MFMHKIGSLVINSTDSLVIANFVSLISVGKFKSYRMVIAAVETITWKGMNGVVASIGNLIAEEDEDNVYQVHQRLFFLNFWVVSFIVISLFNTLDQAGSWPSASADSPRRPPVPHSADPGFPAGGT